MDSVSDIDFSSLSQEVAKAAAAILAYCEQQSPDAKVVGLAFCPDEDVRSVYWVANTSEAVEEDPYSEFEFVDWPLSEDELGPMGSFDGDLGLTEIWDSVDSSGLDFEASFEVYQQVKAKCLEAIAEGLQRFRAASLQDQEDFALLVAIPDDDPSDTVHLVKQLNSEAVYQRYTEATGL